MWNKTIDFDFKIGRLYYGLTILPYQFSLGFTIRWLSISRGFRIYIGPFRFWLSILKKEE